MNKLQVQRTGPIIKPDQSRVLLRPHNSGDSQQAGKLVARILSLSEDETSSTLEKISADFSRRHANINDFFRDRYTQVRDFVPITDEPSKQKQILIGAYFTCEFSLESAALFNPSIVAHPNQENLPAGALRFVLSLRATGEGHISSITFRDGVIHANHQIELQPSTGFLTEPRQIPNARYDKALFERKLSELRLNNEFTRRVISKLGNTFGLDDLHTQLESEIRQFHVSDSLVPEHNIATQGIWTLARSNYEVQFQPEQHMSERILFPSSPSQSNGIEDARFVRFKNDDGSFVYYATFTAYDGRAIMPELVETSDFLRFRFITLNGPAAENKGMALFPRKINGHYAMLSRQDNENIFIMYSDNVHFWYERKQLLAPTFPWELRQLGNCGSPIETEAGWLVLSHGVGPVRKYCIGAFLLDREDPSKVIGRLKEPLIEPNQDERKGYVPNIVYSCGATVHNGALIIPYAMSDYSTSFSTISLDEVLAAMK